MSDGKSENLTQHEIVLRFGSPAGDTLRVPVICTMEGPKLKTTEIEYEGDPKLVFESSDVEITIVEFEDET